MRFNKNFILSRSRGPRPRVEEAIFRGEMQGLPRRSMAEAGLPRRSMAEAGLPRSFDSRRGISMVRGQSLFELVVAMGLVGMVLLTLVALATVSVRNASFSRNQAEAARYGQEAIEWLRLERDGGWVDFVSQTTLTPTRCVRGTSWGETRIGSCAEEDKIDNLFFREVEFVPADTDGDGYFDRIEVLVSVYWNDARGYHEVRNSIYYTDWSLQ
jgi:type II secretory pathway pseudopilin PulG